MRTKVLLGLAALAVGLSTSVAQNVYSLNVVGYVNKTVQANHWYMWGNPLKGTNNTAATVLSGLSGNLDGWDGAVVYAFAGGAFGNADTFVGSGYDGWLPGTTDLTPGKGFFFFSPTNGTVTFVGEVVTTNTFNMSAGWNMYSSAFPATNSLVAMGLNGTTTGAGQDLVYRYNNGYDNGNTYVPGTGWLPDYPNGPVLDVGEAVFYQNNNAATNWTQNFTIQ
jgi:hypothetical protein